MQADGPPGVAFRARGGGADGARGATAARARRGLGTGRYGGSSAAERVAAAAVPATANRLRRPRHGRARPDVLRAATTGNLRPRSRLSRVRRALGDLPLRARLPAPARLVPQGAVRILAGELRSDGARG